MVVQVDGLIATPAEKSAFASPLEKFPKEIPEAEQQRIRKDMLAAINESVLRRT